MGKKKELTRAGISSVVEHSMDAWGLKFDSPMYKKKYWKKTAKNQRNLKYFWGYSGIKVWLALSLDEMGAVKELEYFCLIDLRWKKFIDVSATTITWIMLYLNVHFWFVISP